MSWCGPVLRQAAFFLDFSWLEKPGWLNWGEGHTCREGYQVEWRLFLAVYQVELWMTWHCLFAWEMCWVTLLAAA